MSINGTSPYSRFGDVGASLNDSVHNPTDPANPLSYCLLPTLGTNFLHGASGSSELWNRTWSRNCQNFMAQYCAFPQGDGETQPWNGFCDAFAELNRDTYWPNTSAIDVVTMNMVYTYMKFQPTQGEQLLHNAAERRFLHFPGVEHHLEPFDPTVANSPLVTTYSQLPCGYQPVVRNIDYRTIDQDRLMNKVLEHPMPALDVLTRIYLAWRMGTLQLTGTRLEAFLFQKCAKFDNLARMLHGRIPEYLTVASGADACGHRTSHCASSYPPNGTRPYNEPASAPGAPTRLPPLACTLSDPAFLVRSVVKP